MSAPSFNSGPRGFYFLPVASPEGRRFAASESMLYALRLAADALRHSAPTQDHPDARQKHAAALHYVTQALGETQA